MPFLLNTCSFHEKEKKYIERLTTDELELQGLCDVQFQPEGENDFWDTNFCIINAKDQHTFL